MAFPTTPIHGKSGSIFWLRPNGFKGSGLNDVTWGSFSGASDSSHFEVVIDSELGGGGGVDTFKWRENGGGWTADVDITGASQDMAGANGTQAITFAATTGHTLADQWSIGNLYAEPCTEATNEAYITEPALRLINPNSPPTYTDDGGKNVLTINFTNSLATFSANVGAVTVAGNNGYILESGLQQLGYVKDFSINVTCDLVESSYMGQHWKTWLAGLAGATGQINKMFIGTNNLFQSLKDAAEDTQIYLLLQLSPYDVDQDQTGDLVNVWVVLNDLGINADISGLCMENVGFTVQGIMSTFVAAS